MVNTYSVHGKHFFCTKIVDIFEPKKRRNVDEYMKRIQCQSDTQCRRTWHMWMNAYINVRELWKGNKFIQSTEVIRKGNGAIDEVEEGRMSH